MSSFKNPFAAILDSNKFTGLNYQDWLRNLNLVLASEKLLYTIEKCPPKEAPADISPEELVTLKQWWDDEVKSSMLCDGFDVQCAIRCASERRPMTRSCAQVLRGGGRIVALLCCSSLQGCTIRCRPTRQTLRHWLAQPAPCAAHDAAAVVRRCRDGCFVF
ncbi:hypothetical protein F511_04116 [Dorcoceras hygrometricum]|nr:hypothetical protein F511_04116 [Dorcoceras hygrometricum]